MFDLFHEIGQSLRNNRLRTMLTGMAVAWGIFILIVLLGAARGVVNMFEERFDQSNTIRFFPGRTSMPYKGYKEGRMITLHGADREAIMHDSPNVSDVMAFATNGAAQIFTERDYITGFSAVYPGTEKFEDLEMKYGRFINERDISENRHVIVIHEKNARLLFGADSKALGKTVRLYNLAWTVVGVYTHDWTETSYIPYTAYQKLTGDNDNAYALIATIEGMKTEDDGIAAENAVRGTLSRLHTFSTDDKSAVWVWNVFKSYLAESKALVYLNIAVWIIGIFMLLSGIVGVSNIMFVSVRERTHEIGIRRAIGAKPRAILTQIIAEGIAITSIFGYIGVFLGMAVLQVLDAVLGEANDFKNPTVDISIAINVTLLLIVAGAVAGLFPALKALKVKPVEALRDE